VWAYVGRFISAFEEVFEGEWKDVSAVGAAPVECMMWMTPRRRLLSVPIGIYRSSSAFIGI
jgi:hypothetical protein